MIDEGLCINVPSASIVINIIKICKAWEKSARFGGIEESRNSDVCISCNWYRFLSERCHKRHRFSIGISIKDDSVVTIDSEHFRLAGVHEIAIYMAAKESNDVIKLVINWKWNISYITLVFRSSTIISVLCCTFKFKLSKKCVDMFPYFLFK